MGQPLLRQGDIRRRPAKWRKKLQRVSCQYGFWGYFDRDVIIAVKNLFRLNSRSGSWADNPAECSSDKRYKRRRIEFRREEQTVDGLIRSPNICCGSRWRSRHLLSYFNLFHQFENSQFFGFCLHVHSNIQRQLRFREILGIDIVMMIFRITITPGDQRA